jgi:hypothetical protein
MLTMMFTSLFHQPQRRSRPCPRRPSRPRPLLEWLEPRNLMSAHNVLTDTDFTGPHAETTLAVNPTNAQNLIGSVNDYQGAYSPGGQLVSVTLYSRAHVTFNGGRTWTDYIVPFRQDQYTFTGDPGVAFDADGTAYLATLGWTYLANGDATGADILVTHSTDGGKKWAVPSQVAAGSGASSTAGINNDKPYIAAWGHGNAIVTWTQYDLGPGGSTISQPIFASVTHDGGRTWTAPAQISGPFLNDQGSVPVVAADGSIYVVFQSADQDVAPYYRDHFKVVKVDPATGLPFRAPAEVALVYDGVNDYPVDVYGYFTYQDSQFRAPGFIPGDIAADPTDALHLAVVWSDMRNNPYPGGLLPSSDPYQVKTNSDIIVSQSFDGGSTWSMPTAIKEPNDQFQPWGAYDTDGRLHIGFYDRSYDPANHKYGYTLASETMPGDLHFILQQVTTALSDPTQGDAWFTVTANSNFPNATAFIGDYSNIAISPKGVAALWTDMRLPSSVPSFPGSSEDAFFALVRRRDDEGDSNWNHQGSGSLPTLNRDSQVPTALFAALAKEAQGRAGADAFSFVSRTDWQSVLPAGGRQGTPSGSLATAAPPDMTTAAVQTTSGRTVSKSKLKDAYFEQFGRAPISGPLLDGGQLFSSPPD